MESSVAFCFEGGRITLPDVKQLTFIDFFAGIGGFRRGFELAGMKCVGFCEKDKFAVRSYRAMFDTEGEWHGDDILKLRADDIPQADIWTAGSPCQEPLYCRRKKRASR